MSPNIQIFVLLVLCLGFISLGYAQTLSSQNLVSYIKQKDDRRIVDYMASLNNPNSYIDGGAMYYGDSASISFHIAFYPTSTVGFTLFHGLTTSNDALTFRVAVKNDKTLSLTLGTKVYDIVRASRAARDPLDDEDWDGLLPECKKNNWNLLYVDIVKIDSTSSYVVVFLNKKLWNKVVVDTVLLAGLRERNYVGAFYNKDMNNFNNFFTGFLDNLAIFGITSTPSYRNLCRGSPFYPDADRKNSIQLLMDFDDAVNSVGNTTVAITRTNSPNQYWVVATFMNSAAFIPKSTLNKWFKCQATGDPHGYCQDDTPGFIKIDNLEDQPAGKVFVACGSDIDSYNTEFEVRTYTRYTMWWRWSVYRLVAVRYLDYVYRINLDEASDGFSHPTLGYLTPKLGLSGGCYRKYLSSDIWNPIPSSPVPSYITEVSTGAQYAYTATSSMSTLTVVVPGLAKVVVDAPGGSLSSTAASRYMNIYVDLNSELCPKNKRRKSTCDFDLNVNADPLFRDWLTPAPLPDTPPTPRQPCDGLPQEFVDEANRICSRIYPTLADRRADCVFDACASGDIDVVLQNSPNFECLLQQMEGLPVTCSQFTCPNFCSFRGTCSTNGCVCDAGYVGKDCSQKATFNCFDLSYGSTTFKTLALYTPSAASVSSSALITEQASKYHVESSALIYTTYTKSGASTITNLFIANNHPSSTSGGSYRLCLTVTGGSLGAPIKILKSTSKSLGTFTVSSSTSNCYDLSWQPFASAVLVFQVVGSANINFQVSNNVNLKQVVVGSANFRGDIDVTKIPAIYHNSFNLNVGNCESSSCAQFDFECESCSNQPQCGYCVENGRCLPGDKSGPTATVCSNWRFSFNEAISRVITVTYDSEDLVNPDTEVFLSTLDTADKRVPVNVYVPSLIKDLSNDILFVFSNGGDFASNAQSIKRNFDDLLVPLASVGINFGVAFYNGQRAALTLPLTRVAAQNFYVFTYALDAILGNEATTSNGGQQFALRLAAGVDGTTVGYRVNSKRFAFITLYGNDDAAAILAYRDAVLAARITPVWLVVGSSVEANNAFNFIQSNVISVIDGLPGVVLRVKNDFSNIMEVLKDGIRLGTSLPSVVFKRPDDDLNHVDFNLLQNQADTLFISGMVDAGMRAWFRIPMLRGDPQKHVAEIVVPGYGVSHITDVANAKPYAVDRSVRNPWRSSCVPVQLLGSSFKNLLPVIFKIQSLPSNGFLTEFISSAPNNVGPTLGNNLGSSNGTASTLCYIPFSPTFTGFDTFTYSSFDGCSTSPPATVQIEIFEVRVPPISFSSNFDVMEGNNANLVNAFACNEVNTGETVLFQIMSTSVANIPGWMGVVDPVSFWNLNVLMSSSYNSTPGTPNPNDNYMKNWTVDYKYNDQNFFGNIIYTYVCIDSFGMVSQPSNVTVIVHDVNDAPEVLTSNIMGIEQTWSILEINTRDIDSNIVSVTVEEKSRTADYTLALNSDGTNVVNLPYNCPVSGTMTNACRLYFKMNDNNKNSCINPLACDTSNLLTLFTLTATVSDGLLSTPGDINVKVAPLNDPPTISVQSSVSTLEDTPVILNVDVNDVDTSAGSLSVVVLNTSPKFSVSQQSSTVTSPSSIRVVLLITPALDVYGDNTNNFYLDSFNVKAYDSLLYSDSKQVNVQVTYVNDPPVPLKFSASTDEDVEVAIDLTAQDTDSDILYYRVTSLPDITSVYPNGHFSIFDEFGIPYTLGSNLPTPIFRIKGPQNYFTETGVSINYEVEDTNKFSPQLTDVNIVPATLVLIIHPVVDVPVAQLFDVTTSEDTPVVVQLMASLAWGETGSVTFTIENTPFQRDVYQTISYVDAGNFYQTDSGNLINNGDVVSSASGTIRYVPPVNKNSDDNTAAILRVKPRFTYFVTNSAGTTAAVEIVITIASVNNAPVTWNKPWPGRDDITYSGIQSGSFVRPDYLFVNSSGQTISVCYDECFSPEDKPALVFLGGQDIDFSPSLSFKITSISCPLGYTSLKIKTSDGSWVPLNVNDVTAPYTSGSLHPLIEIVPLPDAFSVSYFPGHTYNGSANHPYYCKIGYKAIDNEGKLSDTETVVTVHVVDVDDLAVCVVTKTLCAQNGGSIGVTYYSLNYQGKEDEDLWLYFNLFDKEGDTSFRTNIVECSGVNGAIFAPQVTNGGTPSAQNQYIDLNDPLHASNFVGLNTVTPSLSSMNYVCKPFYNLSQTPALDVVAPLPAGQDSGKGYFFKYRPNPGVSGSQLERIAVEVNNIGTRTYTFSLIYLYIDILPVNDAPVVYYKTQNGNVVSTDSIVTVPISVTPGTAVNLADHVTDEDADGSLPTFILTVTQSGTGSLTATVAGQTVNAASLNVQGTQSEISQILASLQYKSNSATTATVSITVNDKGSTGVCPTGLENLRKPDGSCPRETKVVFAITVATALMSTITSIAASSGIGAAFVVGAALSVWISRKIKEKNGDSWKEFDEDNFKDFAQTNPIFEEEMSRGSNPLYLSSVEEGDD